MDRPRIWTSAGIGGVEGVDAAEASRFKREGGKREELVESTWHGMIPESSEESKENQNEESCVSSCPLLAMPCRTKQGQFSG